MKRIESIIFRFCCLAGVGGFLFFIAAAIFNPSSEERPLALLFALLGPTAVMVAFYSIRWALTGRVKPWIPH